MLDKGGHVRLTVDGEGRPLSLHVDGRAGLLATADGEAGLIDDKLAHDADCIVAPVDLKLKAAIELKRHTDLPILLVDSLGRLAGLCDDDEIYRGLLRRLDG